MDLGLAGKTALITGGSRGIGRATALVMAEEGASVAICARGREKLDSTLDELRAVAPAAWGTAADVHRRVPTSRPSSPAPPTAWAASTPSYATSAA